MERDEMKTMLQALIDSWETGFDTMVDGIRKYTTPDFLWRNNGYPDVRGHEAAIALFEGARDQQGLASIETDVEAFIIDPPYAAIERIDRMKRADGSVIATLPIVGVFRFENGRIAYWNDSTDSAAFRDAANGAVTH